MSTEHLLCGCGVVDAFKLGIRKNHLAAIGKLNLLPTTE